MADEYIRLGNAAEVALNAGYSQKTAGVIEQENFKAIKQFIDKRLEGLRKESIEQQD
ncbi:terminase small subunit [Edaphobacillus lindanitolerans]|uniref:terminase small subunit n=1 Tax=Edaphobacillus lindanitolerans TaxID=550447 RepID=UPI0009FC11C6|nr:terminase small subunit [Edaphobacillus lindanitolerans]